MSLEEALAAIQKELLEQFKTYPKAENAIFCVSCGRWIGPKDNACHADGCLANNLLEILKKIKL